MWDLCDTPGCAHIATTQPNTFKHRVISGKLSHVGPNSRAVRYFYKHYGEIIFWKSDLIPPLLARFPQNTEQLWNEPARAEFQSDTNLDTVTKTDAGDIIQSQHRCINKSTWLSPDHPLTFPYPWPDPLLKKWWWWRLRVDLELWDDPELDKKSNFTCTNAFSVFTN